MRRLRLLSQHPAETLAPSTPAVSAMQVESRYDLVVLDLDGTICRLDVAWEDVKRELVIIAARHGLDTSGHRRVMPLIHEARRHGSLAAVREMERSLELAELAGASTCLVNEELVGWVEELPSAVPVAVLSLNCLGSVERALRRAGLEWRISDIVARENVDRPKPDPEGLQLLLERHVARASRSLLVGDAETDRACANAAGVEFRHVREIGVLWSEAATSLTA
jgi:phosphoglycolate phosphatase-like HAD superfamily hydrolase